MALHTPTRITVHCTATKDGRRYPIKKIREYHLGLGWSDVGYHAVIQPCGELERGRPLNHVGAHVGGANRGNLGVALVGTEKFTRAQFDALESFYEVMRISYEIMWWDVYCHHEFVSAKRQGKTCPNIRAADLALWLYGGDVRSIKKYLIKEDGNE